jgi:hypothetical protein
LNNWKNKTKAMFSGAVSLTRAISKHASFQETKQELLFYLIPGLAIRENFNIVSMS